MNMTLNEFYKICELLDNGFPLHIPCIQEDEYYGDSNIAKVYIGLRHNPVFAVCDINIAKDFIEARDWYLSTHSYETIVEEYDDNEHRTHYIIRRAPNAIAIPNYYHSLFPDPYDFSKEVIRTVADGDSHMADAIREYIRRIEGDDRKWFCSFDGSQRLLPGIAMLETAFAYPMDTYGYHNMASNLALGYLAKFYLEKKNRQSTYLIFYLLFCRPAVGNKFFNNKDLRERFLKYCMDESYDISNSSFRFEIESLMIPSLQDDGKILSFHNHCMQKEIQLREEDFTLIAEIFNTMAMGIML